MRYSAEHKEQTRKQIVRSAERTFRKLGFGGAGIDRLVREAGVTSGAFYGHFKSKEEAFAATAIAGLAALENTIAQMQQDHGVKWAEKFVDFYLDDLRTCDLAESCALQSLTPDVMRAKASTRSAYEEAFIKVLDRFAEGLPQFDRETARSHARAVLALVAGAVTLARSFGSEEQSKETAQAAREAALSILSP